MLASILIAFVSAVFINNFVVVKVLGICPFLGVSKNIRTAAGMGVAVIFVMTFASSATWAVQEFLLKPLGLDYLQTIAFILVIAALVQLVEMVLQKRVNRFIRHWAFTCLLSRQTVLYSAYAYSTSKYRGMPGS